MRRISLSEISTLCSSMQYAQGFQHVRQGDVLTPWMGDQTIGAQIRNPVRPHTVRVRFGPQDKISPSCTCTVHVRQPFCEHSAALLIAWANDPTSFAHYRGPDTAPLAESAAARREHDPIVGFRVTLDKVEALLLDLFSQGLVTLNVGRAQFMREIQNLAITYGLGRIATQLAALNAEVNLLHSSGKTTQQRQREFSEARYVRALSTAWHLTQSARRALDDGDWHQLREIASLELPEQPAQILESAELVELAYCSSPLPPGRGETCYLLSLGSGQLLAERVQPHPGRAPLQVAVRPPVVRGRVAVYPASDVDEVVLLDVENIASPDPLRWERALGWAQTSIDALVGRLREVVARMPGSVHAHVWFAPARVVAHSGGVHFLDNKDASIAVEPAQAIGRVLLDAPIAGAFGRVGYSEQGLQLTVFGMLTKGDAPEWLALVG